MTKIYSNKEPLQCCEFPNLRNAVGVEVNQYNSRISVNFERVSISVNTASFGQNVSLEEVESKVIESTEWVVSHLEKVIAELQGHRARLLNELANIRANGLRLNDVEAVEHSMQADGANVFAESDSVDGTPRR
jgi:hypothetical protein